MPIGSIVTNSATRSSSRWPASIEGRARFSGNCASAMAQHAPQEGQLRHANVARSKLVCVGADKQRVMVPYRA